MSNRWGASPEEWAHWSQTLGLTEDLLPVVCTIDKVHALVLLSRR